MVSYQAWVSIVFETVESSSSIDSIADGATVMQFAGDAWSTNRATLARYSQAEAEEAARTLLRNR